MYKSQGYKRWNKIESLSDYSQRQIEKQNHHSGELRFE